MIDTRIAVKNFLVFYGTFAGSKVTKVFPYFIASVEYNKFVLL